MPEGNAPTKKFRAGFGGFGSVLLPSDTILLSIGRSGLLGGVHVEANCSDKGVREALGITAVGEIAGERERSPRLGLTFTGVILRLR